MKSPSHQWSSPISGQLTRGFKQLVQRRRATANFRPNSVPDEDVETALTLAAQAPSGYNLQPWRFIVVREPERRAALQRAALNQAKITEAPLVIVAFAEHEGWKAQMDEVMHMRTELTGWTPDDPEKLKSAATQFIQNLGETVWLNRHVMIAFTYLMLAFESLGWDTAPMEGFDAGAVKEVLSLPADAEVVALLAVGRSTEPVARYPGRLAIEQLVFHETYTQPLAALTH
jgi:nitroreductase